MTLMQVIDAISPMLAALSVKMDTEPMKLYAAAILALDIHPADFDDAIGHVQASHAFHSAPTPHAIKQAAEAVQRKRIAATVTGRRNMPPAPAGAGELREHTVPGIGTIRLRILPDDHPSLERVACELCHDTGWAEAPEALFSGRRYAQVARCVCHPAVGGTNPVIIRKINELHLVARKGTRGDTA